MNEKELIVKADGVFRKKAAMTAKGDSLTVVYKAGNPGFVSEIVDNGKGEYPVFGLQELQEILQDAEEFDFGISTTPSGAAMSLTFKGVGK